MTDTPPDPDRLELRSALVGRDDEMAALRLALERTDQGQGGALLLAAEAGMGKTRLCEEIEREAEERGMRFLRGHGTEQRAGLAYGLFVDVLLAHLDRADDDAREEARRFILSLAPHLWDVLFPGDRRPESIEDEDLRPELRQSLFLARMGRLFLDQSRTSSLVLCLEDLHWTDTASLQLLRHLVERCADARLYIVATYRPEAQERGSNLFAGTLRDLAGHASAETRELGPLDEEQIRAMVNSCFVKHNLSAGIIRMLHYKSGGSPLFALQQLEHLRDQRTVYEKKGLWVNSELQERIEPASIRSTLRQRLDRLSADEREVLGHASVQGHTFIGRLVARTLEWPLARVLRILSQLMRRTRLLRIEDEQFRFVHPLLSEVCYELLHPEQQRRAHLRLGDIIAESEESETETLAFHFYRAGAFARALEYLLEAARRTRTAYAYEEAQRYLYQAQEAIESLDTASVLKQRLDTMLLLAEIEDRTGQPDKAMELCRGVLELATTDRDDHSMAQALAQMGWTLHRKGDWAESTRLYQEAAGLFSALGDEPNVAMVFVRQGIIAFERGQLDEAENFFRDAQATATQHGRHAMIGSIYGNLGVIASVRGRYVEAVLNYTEALKAYKRVNHSYGICQTIYNLGMTQADQEQWDKALGWYDKAESLAREMGTIDAEANILICRAPTQIALGDLEAAEQSCQRARALMEQLGDRLGLAECRKVEGIIYRERNEYGPGEEHLQQGRHLFAELENPLGVAECDLELARLLQARGETDAARDRLTESERAFRQLGADDDARRAGEMLAALSP